MFDLLNHEWPYIVGYLVFMVILAAGNAAHLHHKGCLKPFRERTQLVGLLSLTMVLMGLVALVWDWRWVMYCLVFPIQGFYLLFLYYGRGLRRT